MGFVRCLVVCASWTVRHKLGPIASGSWCHRGAASQWGGQAERWSAVMCNLTTQWTVPGDGPLNAGSVREINSRVSPSKNMINTPSGDAAEDEVEAAGSGSAGTRGEVGGWRRSG